MEILLFELFTLLPKHHGLPRFSCRSHQTRCADRKPAPEDPATRTPPSGRLAGIFFQQEKIHATTAQVFALWRAVRDLTPDPAIGLKMGEEPRFELYHPATVAVVCSQSFRDVLHRIARFKQLTCPQEIRVLTTRDEASVEFIYPQAQEPQPDILGDLVLSWILGIGRRGTDSRITPLRLELTRPVRSRALLESHFGCPVRFKASRDALDFRNSDLDCPS